MFCYFVDGFGVFQNGTYALGTKVSIVAKDTEKGNGKLEIEFYSVDDLERISDIMKGNKE